MDSRTQRPPELARKAPAPGLSAVLRAGAKLFILSPLAVIPAQAAVEMPEGLVRRVAERGSQLVAERDHYTYVQRFLFEEIRGGGRAGSYEEVREITFTGTGERDERHRRPPVSRLDRMRLTEEDFRDLRDVNPFVLTLDTLWRYRVRYKGIETVDGMECHTLDLQPKQILHGQRFFEGLVWVDTETVQVVRVTGRPVPQIHRMEESNLFPYFTTQYAPVDGEHWFPVRTEGDDVLPFPTGNQRVRILIEYSDYQRFTAQSSVEFADAPLEGTDEPE